MIDELNIVSKCSDDAEKVAFLDKEIAEKEAEQNRKIIIDNFKQFSDNPERINMQQMWKQMRKLWPKTNAILPTAKRNNRGKIVFSPRDIKRVLSKEYKDRLRSRPARPDLRSIRKQRKLIFKKKMKLASSSESKLWTMEDLEKALSDLKNNKSRDSEGLINELFKPNVIGANLKQSFLVMFNKVKTKKMIPLFLNFTNITTVPKSGSIIEPINERGIFRVSVVRYILMRLIYNSKYADIDRNMSDCQMGARKNKGCKNNIFIINALIHDVLKSKKNKPMVLQIYDYSQMFDSIDLEEALSDIFDAGLNDDNLALLHDANKEVFMSVKTPYGLTERQVLKNIVLQGDTFGSILASVQVDSIGKECVKEGYGYLYKKTLPVGFLGLVDDIIGVTEAGVQAQMMNSFINIKTAEKYLQFGTKKCKSMLIGKDTENVVNNELMVDNWTIDYVKNSDTGEDDLVENYNGQVLIEKTNEYKYLGFVISNKGDNMANISQLRKKSIGVVREAAINISRGGSLNLAAFGREVLPPTILPAKSIYPP